MSERKSQWELFLEEEAAKEAAPKEKRCPRCKKIKLLSEYSKERRSKSGVQSRCKNCMREVKKKYRTFRSKEDRFWKHFNANVERTKEGCLIWTGRLNGTGTPAYGKGSGSVRRLVYRISVGDLPDDMVVLATCGNRLCVNRLHLKLGTHADLFVWMANNKAVGERHNSRTCPERLARGERHGSRTHPERLPRGENNGNAKLTEEQIRIIRQWYRDGVMSGRAIAKHFGVGKKTVQSIIKGETWKHVDAH